MVQLSGSGGERGGKGYAYCGAVKVNVPGGDVSDSLIVPVREGLPGLSCEPREQRAGHGRGVQKMSHYTKTLRRAWQANLLGEHKMDSACPVRWKG